MKFRYIIPDATGVARLERIYLNLPGITHHKLIISFAERARA